MKIKIINGPNLEQIGNREPKIYGTKNIQHYFDELKEKYNTIKFSIIQSNYEGKIIEELQNSEKENIKGIILNAGALTHYSLSIRDAIIATKIPTIEVHISNIFSREKFRRKSVISAVCVGVITGFGLSSYELATYYLQKNFIKK